MATPSPRPAAHRSRWFWLPGAVFAVLIAPLVSPWVPSLLFDGNEMGAGFLVGTALVAAVLTYAVARWQRARPVESAVLAALGAAASGAFIAAVWSGVS